MSAFLFALGLFAIFGFVLRAVYCAENNRVLSSNLYLALGFLTAIILILVYV